MYGKLINSSADPKVNGLPLNHVTLCNVQVLLGKSEQHVKVVLFWQFNIKGETSPFYRLITCNVRYLKHFFVVILLI